jgi:hypothetical protein
LFSSPDTPACSALHWERGGSGEIGEVFSLIKMGKKKKTKQRVILFCEAKCYHWPWQFLRKCATGLRTQKVSRVTNVKSIFYRLKVMED